MGSGGGTDRAVHERGDQPRRGARDGGIEGPRGLLGALQRDPLERGRGALPQDRRQALVRAEIRKTRNVPQMTPERVKMKVLIIWPLSLDVFYLL